MNYSLMPQVPRQNECNTMILYYIKNRNGKHTSLKNLCSQIEEEFKTEHIKLDST